MTKQYNPSSRNYREWAPEIPTRFDWVFFENSAQARRILGNRVRLFKRGELGVQQLHLYSLSERSWHGYAHGRARVFARLNSGELEHLAPQQLAFLAKAHRKLKVPNLISTRALSPSLRKYFPKTGSYLFLSSAGILRLNSRQRTQLYKVWIQQHPWLIFPRRRPLSSDLKRAISQKGLSRYVGHFFPKTGPNCFATAAALTHAKFSLTTANRWLLYPQLLRTLKKKGFKPIRHANTWLPGDIAVFLSDGSGVHAAYHLKNKYFAEKGGQDSYEPIVISSLSDLKRSWGNDIVVWRRP